MKHTPQLYPKRDAVGNLHQVAVSYDKESRDYVASIDGGCPRKMASGIIARPILALGVGDSPLDAVECAMINYNTRKV